MHVFRTNIAGTRIAKSMHTLTYNHVLDNFNPFPGPLAGWVGMGANKGAFACPICVSKSLFKG